MARETGTQTIKRFDGWVIGTVTTYSDGSRIAKDFYGRIVGKYDPTIDMTKDFYGRFLGRGDFVVSTLYDNEFTQKENQR